MPNQYVDADGNRKPDAPAGQNHFTTGKRDRQDAATRAKLRATLAANKLEAYLNGEIALEAAQVSAAKILMDKGMPSLQAVEQTQVNEWDQMSEEEIKDTVRALILSRPELLQDLNLQPVMKAVEGSKEVKSA